MSQGKSERKNTNKVSLNHTDADVYTEQQQNTQAAVAIWDGVTIWAKATFSPEGRGALLVKYFATLQSTDWIHMDDAYCESNCKPCMYQTL